MSTAIEWTDETWNPVVGCTKVSQGCKNCYAKTIHDLRHKAFKSGKAVASQYQAPFETVQLKDARLSKPLSWRKPRRVFVNSVSDLFHEDVPDEYIAQVFQVMAEAERHTFQILTKRPLRMLDWFYEYLPDACSGERPAPIWPLPNVWLGVSVENQAAADERIPLLLRIPAAVRFLSCEPLLGPIDLHSAFYVGEEGGAEWVGATRQMIHWVIAGGESGTDARPMHPEWARSLRDQCARADVSFFFKQWGEWAPVAAPHLKTPSERRALLHVDGRLTGPPCGPELALQAHGDWCPVERFGKKRAGRSLDGRTWDEFPAVRA